MSKVVLKKLSFKKLEERLRKFNNDVFTTPMRLSQKTFSSRFPNFASFTKPTDIPGKEGRVWRLMGQMMNSMAGGTCEYFLLVFILCDFKGKKKVLTHFV